MRCESEAFVVTVRTADQREHRRRVLRTAEVGDVPERYLAVEIAELVETAEDASSTPPSGPAGLVSEASTAPNEPRFRRSGWIAAGGRFRVAGRPVAPSGGASVVVGGRLLRALSLRAELLGLGGARRIDGDGVRLGFVGGSVAALATFDAGSTALHVGGGALVGEIWIHGIPEGEGEGEGEGVIGLRHHGTTWSPFASLGVLAPGGRRGVFGAHVDVGWTVRPVRGFSGPDLVFSSGGPWLGVSVTGGIGLGR